MPGRTSLMSTARPLAFAKFVPTGVTTTATVTSSVAVAAAARARST